MHKLIDLFCLTILFAKFNILASFILHFLANIEGYTPNKIFLWSKGIVSRPIKYEGKLFMADGGQLFWVTVLHGGLMIISTANREGIYT